MLQTTWNSLKNGATWVLTNRAPLSILLIQYSAIVISIKNHQNADYVLWLWGVVAFAVGAITGGSGKFNSGFWYVIQLVFGGLLAVCGYFFLP